MSDITNKLLYPCNPEFESVTSHTSARMGSIEKLRYGWSVIRTRILWGARLYALGGRTVLGRKQCVRHPKAVAIGSHVTICDGFVLTDLDPQRGTPPKIRIGDGVTILFRFQCNAAESVTIEDNVLFASNVLITDSDHVLDPAVPMTRNHKLKTSPVVVEHDCWIGQNAVIVKGVTVGHHSIIGANSVVTRSIPPFSVAVGNPARVVKSISQSPPAGNEGSS